MLHIDSEREFVRGATELSEGNALAALVHFEKAVQADSRPRYLSYLGYCVALQRGQVQKGIGLCRQSIAEEPGVADHYLNLGRILLLAGNKAEALEVLRAGMAVSPHPGIGVLLEKIGSRKPPVIGFLGRDNIINKHLGLLLGRLGMR
jgi:tetratricopeptide (TPR) repeat protein